MLMPCVLVVEDDTDVREMFEMLLQFSGYETMTAANGAEGLERMRERRPCVVLLDLMMPVMDGFTFREQQLQEPSLAKIPVVCVTGGYEPAYVSRRLALRCVPKSAPIERVLTEVEQFCRQPAAIASGSESEGRADEGSE
jgi:CheY-like chemotaxis protein